jgi:thiol-disulfide isomerase/thioredoxin
MKILKFLIALAVLGSALVYGKTWLADPSGDGSAKTLGLSPACAGKKICVTVYIAPWCGVCRSTEPSFFAVNKFLPRLRPDSAFGVVIGAASIPENAQLKKHLAGLDAYTDDSGAVMRARGVNQFPTWIVTDGDGNEIHRAAGGFYASTAEEVSEILEKFLKL